MKKITPYPFGILAFLLGSLGAGLFIGERVQHSNFSPREASCSTSQTLGSTLGTCRLKPERTTQSAGSRYVAAITAVSTDKPFDTYAEAEIAYQMYSREKTQNITKRVVDDRDKSIRELTRAYAMLLDLRRHFGRIAPVEGRLKTVRDEILLLIDQ